MQFVPFRLKTILTMLTAWHSLPVLSALQNQSIYYTRDHIGSLLDYHIFKFCINKFKGQCPKIKRYARFYSKCLSKLNCSILRYYSPLYILLTTSSILRYYSPLTCKNYGFLNSFLRSNLESHNLCKLVVNNIVKLMMW